MPINALINAQRAGILDLAARHGARNVRIFGSMVHGTSGPESDVDLVVDLDEGRSLLDLGRLLMDLQDLLGRKVDIVTEQGLHWYIRDRVLKDAVRL